MSFSPFTARGVRRIAGHRAWCFGLALAVAAPAIADSHQVRVLHWWNSTSERMALDMVATSARRAGIDWVNEDTSAGIGAGIVLRSRILAHDMPDVIQANSLASENWTRLGLVLDLDEVAAAGQWERRLLPAVYRMIRPAGHVISAPLGMHRTNTLLYNRDVLARLNVSPPRTWDEFERIAPQLLRAGIMPLAQSSEPWQVAILFENLLLADRGLDLHRRLFARHDVHAFADPGLGAVLLHLRRLKRWMRTPVPETEWGAVAGAVARGEAAMVVSGDWIKGELLEAGSRTGRAVGCMAAPGTENMHVYDLDTLVMLRSDRVPRAVQERIAQITVEPPLQERYNRIKGSVTVLRNIDPATLDACARASWTMLADPAATLVPSLAIGMIADEAMRDALVAEIHRFFMDDSVTVQDTQRRLATISRAFFQIPTP